MKFSIRTKLVAFIFSIVLLVGGTISLYAIYRERQQSLGAYASENREVAVLLSDLVLDDLDFNDLVGLRRRLRDAQAYPRILYAYVMDADGTILADGSGANYLSGTRPSDPFNKKILRATNWVTLEEDSVLKIGGPVSWPGKKPLGYLAVGFSLSPAYQDVRQATSANLAITAAGLVIGGILAFVLATQMTRPISDMAQASRKIGEGDFNTRLPMKRHDELGRLAQAINQMAEDLRQTTISKGYLDEIIRSLQEPLIVLTPEARIQTVNPATLSILGYGEKEMIGMPMAKVLYSNGAGKNSDELFEGIEEIRSKGSVSNLETSYRTKEGSEVPVLFSGSVMRSPSGKVQGITCVARDITNRKRAEQALRIESTKLSNEKHFIDSTINSLPGAFYMFDQEGRFLRWNKNFETDSEYSSAEIQEMNPLDFFADEEKALVIEKIEEVFTQGRSSVEAHMISKSGRMIPYFFTGSRIEIDGGIYLGGWGIDISERKKMEETLKKSEERHRSLTEGVLDTSDVGIFILDASFRVAWVNRAIERFSGLDRNEIVGKDRRQFIRERIRNLVEHPEEFIEKVFATYDDNTYIENFECHVLPASGREERWIEHWSEPIRAGLYAGGRIEHYYDITERKRAEEALRRSELQVRQAFEEREQLGRDLHDGILQSLFAVNLGLETSKSIVQEDACGAITHLDRAIEQLKVIMREVRQFISGVPSDMAYHEDFALNVRTLVHNMTAAHATHFQLEIDPEAAKKVSRGQAVHLLNVLREGISNTLRHAHAKHGHIAIQWRKDEIRLVLSDDGIGFDLNPTSRGGHGLENMKARASLMGGEFDVRCEQGQGTRITLGVPYEPADDKS